MSGNYLFVGEDLTLGTEDIDSDEKAACNTVAGSPISEQLLQNFIDGCVEDGLYIEID